MSVDPCQPGNPRGAQAGHAEEMITLAGRGGPPGPFPIGFYVGSVSASPAFASHLVVRGTYLPGTIRCIGPETYRLPSYTRTSNRLYDMGPGGVYRITCFADVRVGEYILGSGPATLTVLVDMISYESTADLWPPERAEVDIRRAENAFINGGSGHNLWVPTGLPGQERILFLNPSRNTLIEAWESGSSTWDVQREEGSTPMVIHPSRDYWRDISGQWETYQSKTEMTLPDFKRPVTAAHQTRLTKYGGRIYKDPDYPDYVYPMLRTNANDLRLFMADAGAYSRPGGLPVMPPPACGLVVADQTNNGGLMKDCRILLETKYELRGMGTLNWDIGEAISDWDGVTVAGTPKRVTKLKLTNKSLTGTIPWGLTGLTALTELKLAGNTLTGCIHPDLKDIESNDLASLSLPDCPPAPGGLTGTATEYSVALRWNAVSNTTKYRLEYRARGSGGWTVLGDTLTGTTHTLSGLSCEIVYHWFRVGAYGSGTVYAAAWSDWSAALTVDTGRCAPPAFGASSYSFSVPADADAGAAVGRVSAAGSEGADDTVMYVVPGGNEDGKFDIGESTGKITVAGDLSAAVGTSFTLTVEAADESGGVAAVTVTIAVTRAAARRR